MSALLRVLMVEDSETDAKLVLNTLRAAGHRIESDRVEDAGTLIAALGRHPWDLVISDWTMPRFRARDALAIVRAEHPDVPFIIVSGTAGEENAVAAMRAGAQDYVFKGNLTRLSAAVERELRESKVRATHRRAEESLRQSEARYRVLFENSPLPKLLYDLETLRFLAVNDAAVQQHGYSREEFLQMTITDITPPGDVEAVLREARRANREPRTFGRWRSTKKGGAVIDVEVTSSAFELEGRLTRLVVSQDITERERAHAAVRANAQRLATIFRLTRVGLIVVRVSDRKIIEANDTFLEQVGWTRQEVIGRTTLDLGLYSPEDVSHIYDGVREQERIGATEMQVRRKSGETGHFLITGASTEIDGEVCIIGAWHDITKLRQADAARRESDERFRQIAEGVREVFWLNNPQSTQVLYVSPAYESIWGRSCQSLYDSPKAWADAIHPEDRERVLQASMLQTNGKYDEEFRILRPDGAVRWIRAHSSPVRDPNGEIVSIAGVAEDITERRGLEDQLRQAQKLEAIGSLAGGVAHDFNNILSVILTYSDLLIGDLEPGAPMRADLQEIQKAGQRAGDLTRQLLAFSRRQVLQPKVIDLNQVITGMEKMLRRLIGEDVDLAVIPSPSPARVNVDPGQVEQVIMNLAVNARDAMPEGGKLTIEIAEQILDESYASKHGARPGPHVMLAVSDNGTGMDAATQARVFEPFFTTKEVGKGTGLGLSTVFGIVRQSEGSIWLYSEPGIGTTFKVYLPAVAQDVETPAAGSPEPAFLRGSETILLVEDEEGVRKAVRGILERNGYHVLEARSGDDAVIICEQHPAFQLLLTDVVMPRMSGAQLAARLQQARPDLKVVYMSGYTDNSVVLHGVLHAEVAFVQKPITPRALLTRIREVLDSPPSAPEATTSGRARVLLIDDEVLMHRVVASVLSDHQVVVKSDPQEALAMLAAGERFDVILCDLNLGKMNGMQFHQALSAIDAGAAGRMLFVTGGALNAASESFIHSMAGRVLQKPVDVKQLRETVATLLATGC